MGLPVRTAFKTTRGGARGVFLGRQNYISRVWDMKKSHGVVGEAGPWSKPAKEGHSTWLGGTIRAGFPARYDYGYIRSGIMARPPSMFFLLAHDDGLCRYYI